MEGGPSAEGGGPSTSSMETASAAGSGSGGAGDEAKPIVGELEAF